MWATAQSLRSNNDLRGTDIHDIAQASDLPALETAEIGAFWTANVLGASSAFRSDIAGHHSV